MSSFALTPRSPLDGLRLDFDGVTLAEITGRAIVSIAISLGGEAALEMALSDAYGAALPTVGASASGPDDDLLLLRLQRDLMFLLFDRIDDHALNAVAANLGDAGYYTDQSDSWVMLHLAGPMSRAVLERLCMIDLDPNQFAEGAVTATVMDHLRVIMSRVGPDSFLLMSAASSAKSFLVSLQTSIQNVL